MDIRLFDAAWTGNIDSLHQLLAENVHLLDQLVLFSSENPLYIAYRAGQLEFVKEIFRFKPDLAKEVNQDGFSLMHMAVVNRHLELVRELMNVDPSFCRLQETRNNKTPLHFAAMKGRVEEISEMISGCADCVEDVTLQGETALHLAVKCGHFEVVGVLVRCIRELKKEHVFNIKDEQGNTVLHLAAWRKRREVIELLLDNERFSTDLLDVNAINQSNLSALDMVLVFPSEAGDREIVDIFRGAAALRARDIGSSSTASSDSQIPSEVTQLKPKELVEYFKFKRGRDSPSEARGTLLIIAALVAAATFQVAFNPPCGIWQDDYFPNRKDTTNSSSSNNSSKPHRAGLSILGTHSGVAFAFFAIFNSIGFSVSLYMINILTSKFPLQFELGMCTMAMFYSYNCAIISISPEDNVRIVVIITSIILNSFTVPVLLSKWAQKFISWIVDYTLA